MVNLKLSVNRILGIRMVMGGWIVLLSGFIIPNLAPSLRMVLFILAAILNGFGLVILLLKK